MPDQDIVTQSITGHPEISATQKIVETLDESPDKDFSAEELQPILQSDNLASVRSALARLESNKKITRRTRGRYASIAATAKPIVGAEAN